MVSSIACLALVLPALVAAQALPAITAAPKLRRQIQEICDPVSRVFVCDRGTCYWGDDGFVGCCSTTSCVPRTTCIESAELATAIPCDHNTGGCVICSRAEAPFCVTNTNIAMGHYAMYCDTVRAVNAYSYTYSWPGLAAVTTAQDDPGESNGSEPTRSGGDTSAAQPSETRAETSTTGISVSRPRSSDGSATSTRSTGSGSGDSGEDPGGNSSEAQDSGSSTWAIVGGVLGGALFVAVVVLVSWRWRKARRREQSPPSVTTPSTATHPMLFASPHPSQPSPNSPHGFALYAPSSITGYSPPPPAFDSGGSPYGGVMDHSFSNQSSSYAHELPADQPPSRHELGGNQHFWRGAG